jgi:hypothetical protein
LRLMGESWVNPDRLLAGPDRPEEPDLDSMVT